MQRGKDNDIMFIEELPSGQPITLMVIAHNQQLEFQSSVLECFPRKHMITATPVMKDGKIIAFNGKGILIHLIVYFADQKPIVFQNVTIQTARKDESSLCYIISTLAESKEFNRRGAFRCYIGIQTSIRCGTNRSTIPATIKDVSTTGFAITVSPENELKTGSSVHAVLNDYIEETSTNYSFHLIGNVVRSYTLENGNIVHGCQFNTRVIGLDRYLMEKERIRVQRNRGNTHSSTKKNDK